ncbi:MAG: hypothetical protein IJD19_06350 [Ruminococcus sp.]|nr:hypothetical protein [Ruminococcus sp.]
MANFCKKCGSRLDAEFSLCPACDAAELAVLKADKGAEETVRLNDEPTVKVAPQPAPVAKTPAQKQSKPAPKKAAPAKPKKKRKWLHPAVSAVIVVILSLVLIVTSLTPMLIFSVRGALKEDNIEKIIYKADLIAVMKEIPVSGEYTTSDNFYYALCDFMEDEFGTNITESQMERFIEKSDIREDIAEKIDEYIDDVFDGTSDFELDRDEVARILIDNRADMVNAFEVPVSNEHCIRIAEWIIPEDGVEEFYPETLREDMPMLMLGARFGLSYVTAALLIAVSVITVILMLVASISQGLIGSGIVLTLDGILFAVPTVLSLIAPLWETICGGEYLIAFISSELLKLNVVSYILVLLLGAVLLIAGIVVAIIRIVKNKKNKKQLNAKTK